MPLSRTSSVAAAAAAASAVSSAEAERAALERKVVEHETNLAALKQMQADFAPMYEMAPEMGEKARSDIAAQERTLLAARQAVADFDRRAASEQAQAAENRTKLEARQLEAAEVAAAKKKAELERAAAEAAERERARKQREDEERAEREGLERELAEREKKLAEQRAREERLLLEREAAERKEALSTAPVVVAAPVAAVAPTSAAAAPVSPRAPSDAAEADAALSSVLAASMREPRVSLSASSAASRYAPLLELLPGSSLLLINALCVAGGSTFEADVLSAVCHALDGHRMLHEALTAGVASEVAETSNAGTLFRSNTAATKLIGAYTRLCGQAYLGDLLRPLIGELAASGDDLEVDPTKCDEAAARAHQPLLRSWAERFLAAVYESLPTCPLPLRWLCARVVQASVHRFPDSKLASAGGFLFLRFICPALMTPKARGVLKADPTPVTQRGLLLISKLLQNLANNVEFKKEPYMLPLNSFVTDKQIELAGFFDKFVDVDLGNTSSAPLASAADADAKHLAFLHAFVAKHADKIKQSLVAYKQDATAQLLDKALGALGAVTDARLLDTYGGVKPPVAASPAPLSPRGPRSAVGPEVDVKAGLSLRIVHEVPSAESATKTVRAEFSTTVAGLLELACAKFELAPLAEHLELYVPTPVDSVLKTDKTLNSYHFLAKGDAVVELRWRAGTPSWSRYATLEASKALPATERVRELKIRKMMLAGLVAKRDVAAVAARAEMQALDELLGTLEDTTRTMITKPIDRGARRRAQTTLTDGPPAPGGVVSPRAGMSASNDAVDALSPRPAANFSAGVLPPRRPNSPPPLPRTPARTLTPQSAPPSTPPQSAPPSTPPQSAPPPRPTAVDSDVGGFGGLLARAQQMRKGDSGKSATMSAATAASIAVSPRRADDAKPAEAPPPVPRSPPRSPPRRTDDDEVPEAPPPEPALSQSTKRGPPPTPVARPAAPEAGSPPARRPVPTPVPRAVPRPPARNNGAGAVLPPARIERRKTPPGALSAPPPLTLSGVANLAAKPLPPTNARSSIAVDLLEKPPALVAPPAAAAPPLTASAAPVEPPLPSLGDDAPAEPSEDDD